MENNTGITTEKVVFKKRRHKRLSDAAQMNLTHIAESDEIQKHLKIHPETIGERRSFESYGDDSFESDSLEEFSGWKKEKELYKLSHEKDEKTTVNKMTNERTADELLKRKMHHDNELGCQNPSENKIKTKEVQIKKQVDQVNKTQGNKFSVECEKSINKKSSRKELKLDLTKLNSETDSSSEMDIPLNDRKNKSVGDSPKNFNDLLAFSPLKHTCKHGTIDYTPRKGDAAQQVQKADKTPRKCILCDINGASVRTKAIQTDSDKLLSELIYPYEFYDRFSRADKRQNDEKTKEVISIVQQAKVVERPITPMRVTPVIHVPDSTPSTSDKGSTKESTPRAPKPSPIETGEVENEKETRKEKKVKRLKRVEYLYEPRDNFKTEFHEHCGNTLNALVVSEHTEGQKRTLPGLKGYFQQQKDAKTSPKAIKQCKYFSQSLVLKSILHYVSPVFGVTVSGKAYQTFFMPKPGLV